MTSTTPTVNAVPTPTVTNVPTPTMPDASAQLVQSTQAATTPTHSSGTVATTSDAVSGYTPTFSAVTRTVIYVVCVILGALGMLATVASITTDAPTWLTIGSAVCAWLAPYIANAFGVAYNPLKIAGK